jgi:hypothetical protein
MSLEGIVVGLLAILVGLAWAFYGLKAFTLLLPIWAFFIGLLAGAEWASQIFGGGFFGSVTSWIIGLVLGIVLAVLSYFWYYAAVVILGATLGYTLGAGIMEAIGITGFLSIVVGLIVGAVFAVGIFVLAVPAFLVIAVSAIGGAMAAVNGVLILLGRIDLDDIHAGRAQGLLKEGVIGIVAVIAIAAAGILYQTRSVVDTAVAIDRSTYRIA